MTEKTSELLTRVKQLYARLQANSLTDADVVPLSEVELPDYSETIRGFYNDRPTFEAALGYFIPTFDVFSVFRDPKQLVLDVGAHFGYSAIAMRYHGCQAKIVSIDAIPSNLACLSAIKALEGDSYDYIHRAVGGTSGVLRMFMPVMNGVGITAIASTGATLCERYAFLLADTATHYKPRTDSGVDEVHILKLEIESASLDEIFEARGDEAERIVAIKMDLEGHEGPAIKGSERIFRRTKPLLMIENANKDPMVVEAMFDYGYFHCERHQGVLKPHAEISFANDGFWIHPSRVEEYRSLGIFEGAAPASSS